MSESITPVYVYDGSFDGLLCCLFTAYTLKEDPDAVTADYGGFLPTRNVLTDDAKVGRVKNGIIRTMGYIALDYVKNAFLSERDGIEANILKFLKLGFTEGESPHRRTYEDCVKAVTEASKYALAESHRIKQFLRLCDSNGVLTSVISPKANVLPLIARHFTNRFSREKLLIYDDVRKYALVYIGGETKFIPLEEYSQPQPDENERKYRELFTLFYNTIEIKPRHNERCRMNFMPKRFWKNMTEFITDI